MANGARLSIITPQQFQKTWSSGAAHAVWTDAVWRMQVICAGGTMRRWTSVQLVHHHVLPALKTFSCALKVFGSLTHSVKNFEQVNSPNRFWRGVPISVRYRRYLFNFVSLRNVSEFLWRRIVAPLLHALCEKSIKEGIDIYSQDHHTTHFGLLTIISTAENRSPCLSSELSFVLPLQ